MPNLRNFEFNSKYPIDNVCFVYDGTMSLSYGYGSTTLSHSLGFAPLAFGLYSIDGGSTWSEIDFQVVSIGFGQILARSSTVEVSLSLYSSSASSAKIRVFAFMPSNITASVSAPTPLSRFYLNTKYGYDMLIAKGISTIPSSSSETLVYTHNLGYIPRVMTWSETTDAQGLVIRRLNQATQTTLGTGFGHISMALVDETTFKYDYEDELVAGSLKLHWRLYGGQNA